MIRRDYIMRLFDQLAAAIGRLLSLRKVEQYQEARVHLAEAFRSLVGLSDSLVESLAVEDLARMLVSGGEPDPGKLVIAARLLEEQGLLHEAQGAEDRAAEVRLKALQLYLRAEAVPDEAKHLDRSARIEGLVKLLGDALDEDTQARLRAWRDR